MPSLKLPDRDSLGWLIPILLFFVFYGAFLFFNRTGLLQYAGLLFFVGSVVGLSFSRRVRRLVAYHLGPKTDERRIAFESAGLMQRARVQAKKEKIPELITSLYFNYIRNFPQWIATEVETDQKIVPSIVTAAQNSTGNRILVTISGKEYICTFVQYVYTALGGGHDTKATLQIATTEQKLILINLALDPAVSVPRFIPVSLEHVVMSDWVNDFRHLQELIDSEKKRREHEDDMN